MKIQQRRKLSAWVLLSVFVPMVLLSSLHRHAEQHAAVCDACVQHLPHAGHLSQGTVAVDNCLLCQFFSLAALTATATFVFLFCAATATPLGPQPFTLQGVEGIRRLRAPPVLA